MLSSDRRARKKMRLTDIVPRAGASATLRRHAPALPFPARPVLPQGPHRPRREAARLRARARAAVGAPRGVPGAQPRRRGPGAGGARRRRLRRPDRDLRTAGGALSRAAAAGRRSGEPGRDPPPGRLVRRQVPPRGHPQPGGREDRQAAGRARRTGLGGDPRRQGQHPRASRLYRLAQRPPALARRRRLQPRRRRRGGAAFRRRLPGRRALERSSRGQGLVRAGEIAAELPPAARRPPARRAAAGSLRLSLFPLGRGAAPAPLSRRRPS